MKYLVVIALVVFFAFCVNARLWSFTASLKGGNEVPKVKSNHTGNAEVVFDDESFEIMYKVTSKIRNAKSIKLYKGYFGKKGSIQMTFTNADLPTPLGDVTGTSTDYKNDTEISSFAKHLMRGGIYIDIATNKFPNGEIRGQLIRKIPYGFQSYMDEEQVVFPGTPAPFGGANLGLSYDDISKSLYFLFSHTLPNANGLTLNEGSPFYPSGVVYATLSPSGYVIPQSVEGTVTQFSVEHEVLKRALSMGLVNANLYTFSLSIRGFVSYSPFWTMSANLKSVNGTKKASLMLNFDQGTGMYYFDFDGGDVTNADHLSLQYRVIESASWRDVNVIFNKGSKFGSKTSGIVDPAAFEVTDALGFYYAAWGKNARVRLVTDNDKEFLGLVSIKEPKLYTGTFLEHYDDSNSFYYGNANFWYDKESNYFVWDIGHDVPYATSITFEKRSGKNETTIFTLVESTTGSYISGRVVGRLLNAFFEAKKSTTNVVEALDKEQAFLNIKSVSFPNGELAAQLILSKERIPINVGNVAFPTVPPSRIPTVQPTI